MPKLLRLKDFAKAGLNTDLMPWDLPGDFLTEIRNIRILRGKLSPFGGHLTWAILPEDFIPGYIMHVGATSVDFWIIPGQDAVWVYEGGNFSDISNLDGYAGIINEDLWSGCMLTSIPIINNPGHYPEYWPAQNGATPMEYLPWDATNTWKDVGETCRIMRSHKQFLFALDLQSGADEIPDGVRWSAPADIGGIPNTWDPLDVTDVAGIVSLGGDGGRIIDGRSLRDAFIIYRERGISVFDFVGGQFVWRIRHYSTTTGLIADDALVEVRGQHYFIGDGDAFTFDGNSMKSLMNNKVRKRFLSSINPDTFRNSYVVKNNIAAEVWFCVPTSESEYPNIAYVYNWEGDSWSLRDIPLAPMANYGPQSSESITWETVEGTWNTTNLVWDQRQLTPLDDTIIAVTKPADGNPGELLLLDKKNVDPDAVFDSLIERISFALEGLNQVTTITRVYPHMRGPGKVFIQVGSQDHPGSPVRWKPAVEFDAEKDRKVDIRTTGEMHCFRVYDRVGNNYWELSGFDIEYVLAGLR